MRIGIGLPNTVPGPDPQLIPQWAQRAEQRGFAFVSTVGRVGYPSYASLTALAVVVSSFAAPSDARSIVADRVMALTRSSSWTLAASVPIAFRTFHPQGMVKIGETLLVSSVEVVDRGDAEPDLRQRSELVQGDRLARAGALQALHCVFVSARDAVEDRDDIACFGIGFLDRGGEQ